MFHIPSPIFYHKALFSKSPTLSQYSSIGGGMGVGGAENANFPFGAGVEIDVNHQTANLKSVPLDHDNFTFLGGEWGNYQTAKLNSWLKMATLHFWGWGRLLNFGTQFWCTVGE